MLRYAITIFLSAFLLFQVQPLIGKKILPWFGGTPAVWTTCLLFFQAALLAGYSYAHFVSSKLSPRNQMILHLGLLIASLAFLPIMPLDSWKPSGEELPIGRILALLGATIGLPYVMLSTTGPLLQESYRRETGHPPYRLYALSNVGSLLALLTYPFLVEPQFTLPQQVNSWSAFYVVFAVFCGWCTLGFVKPARHVEGVPESVPAAEPSTVGEPTWREFVLWLALAACGTAMLMATTNQMTQEITPIPFLWIVPLALYLITFIICFDHERWYHRPTFLVLLAAAIGAAFYAMNEGHDLEMWWQVAIYSFTMWVFCMVCHGELVRSKPAAQYATLFYLMVSAGGVIGGVLVAVVAPMVLNDYWEYRILLGVVPLLAAVALLRPTPEKPLSANTVMVVAGTLVVGVGMALGWWAGKSQGDPTEVQTEVTLETSRNFYGVLHVNREDDPDDPRGASKELIHGRIQHGFQFLDPERKDMPTTYYGHASGVGMSIDLHPRRQRGESMRIGVVGLGCGTLATYARENDFIRFYEINPEVLRISDEHFSFRKDAAARGANVEVVMGDARIQMERDDAADNLQRFDVLAVDAFSSDAIPMHLLTRECVELYRKHMKPDGILCLHISNRYLDLTPVVRGIAEAVGTECVLINSPWDGDLGTFRSSWALLTDNREFLEQAAVADAIVPWTDEYPDPILWTDDYASLWHTIDED